MEITMEYRTFSEKLYQKFKKSSNNDEENVKIYADLLGKIFYDVKTVPTVV